MAMNIITEFDYKFETRLRSVRYATSFLGRRAALRRLMDAVDRMMLVVRYDPTRMVLVEPNSDPTYAWCPKCRLNRYHDISDAAAMRVACRQCDDDHAFREAG